MKKTIYIFIFLSNSILFSDTHYITKYKPGGLYDKYQTIFLTDNPDESDIIVVVDFNTIENLFSDFSIYEIILEKYDSKNVKKLIIEKIKDNGGIIYLSNGSSYRVYDDYITNYWYEYDSVYLINDNTLIKDDEQVDVYKIK